MKTRIPVLNNVAITLDSWAVDYPTSTLTYRFAIDLDGMRCRATGDILESEDIHELTRERVAQANEWHWEETR